MAKPVFSLLRGTLDNLRIAGAAEIPDRAGSTARPSWPTPLFARRADADLRMAHRGTRTNSTAPGPDIQPLKCYPSRVSYRARDHMIVSTLALVRWTSRHPAMDVGSGNVVTSGAAAVRPSARRITLCERHRSDHSARSAAYWGAARWGCAPNETARYPLARQTAAAAAATADVSRSAELTRVAEIIRRLPAESGSDRIRAAARDKLSQGTPVPRDRYSTETMRKCRSSLPT